MAGKKTTFEKIKDYFDLYSDFREENKVESYRGHARKLSKNSFRKKEEKDAINRFYSNYKIKMSKYILQEAPLRYFTHDRQIGKGVSSPDPDYGRVLIKKVDNYIYKYELDLDKDVTLEEAVEKIIE